MFQRLGEQTETAPHFCLQQGAELFWSAHYLFPFLLVRNSPVSIGNQPSLEFHPCAWGSQPHPQDPEVPREQAWPSVLATAPAALIGWRDRQSCHGVSPGLRGMLGQEALFPLAMASYCVMGTVLLETVSPPEDSEARGRPQCREVRGGGYRGP